MNGREYVFAMAQSHFAPCLMGYLHLPMSRNAGRSAARPSRMHDHSISVMDIISPKSAAVILVNSMVELAGLSELDDGEVDVLVELASVEPLEDDGPVA